MTKRCEEIDGLRGIAALVVLLCHMIVTPFGHLEPILSPSFLLLNGTFAVQVFFVLSGDALSARFFATGDTGVIDRLVIKRYFRLTFLILISSFCIFLIKSFGQDWHIEAARVTNNALFAAYLPQAPDIDAMLRYALAGVYIDYAFHSDAAFYASLPTAYNPVFWSMALELSGSLLIFLFLYAYPRLQNPRLVLFFLCGASFLLFTSYAGFFFGLTLGYARHQGWLVRWQESRSWQWFSLGCLALLIVASCFPINTLGRGALVLLAGLLVFMVYTNKAMLRFLHCRAAQWLGKISFPLYAIHFAVLISLTSFLVIFLSRQEQLTLLTMAGVSVISICSSLAAAYLLWRIEFPYLMFLERVAADVLQPKTAKK